MSAFDWLGFGIVLPLWIIAWKLTVLVGILQGPAKPTEAKKSKGYTWSVHPTDKKP